MQLVVSVLISTLTLHAGLESYQSQTHLPSQRAQHTCDTCLTLQAGDGCGGERERGTHQTLKLGFEVRRWNFEFRSSMVEVFFHFSKKRRKKRKQRKKKKHEEKMERTNGKKHDERSHRSLKLELRSHGSKFNLRNSKEL